MVNNETITNIDPFTVLYGFMLNPPARGCQKNKGVPGFGNSGNSATSSKGYAGELS